MKKHVKLYNRMFEALHYDDKFVLCLDKTHQEIVAIMADALEAEHQKANPPTYKQLAEAALTAVQNAMDGEALSNDTLGALDSMHKPDVADGCRSRAKRFRKRPVVVEAFKLGIDPIPDWFMDLVISRRAQLIAYCDNWQSDIAYATIETLEGFMRAERGNWIIRGVAGEVYPCKPDIFAATYEAVE